MVSKKMSGLMGSSSWIRKMFEEGTRLKSIHGSDNVFDFSLGNPDIAPPDGALKIMADISATMYHGYMPNAGYPDVRHTVAGFASKTYGANLGPEDIIMSCGAGGALNVVLKAICDQGDEVIAIAPYFVEYGFYADNHGGKLVAARCDKDFLPDIDSIEEAITDKTKAIIINSPNNPTGRVYPHKTLADLAGLLKKHPGILVISDEPYRRLAYDNIEVPSVLNIIPNSVVVTSASKELSLAGERIGYIALGPGLNCRRDLADAMILATRILGFVNAPGLMQRVFAACIEDSVDIGVYKRRRDTFTAILDNVGLSYARPEGAFYLFVKSPMEDDIAFCKRLLEERILAVPGKGFGCGGYVRFAYCTRESVIEACAPGLARVMDSLRTGPA